MPKFNMAIGFGEQIIVSGTQRLPFGRLDLKIHSSSDSHANMHAESYLPYGKLLPPETQSFPRIQNGG